MPSQSSSQANRVSSPIATGQGGAFFEQHVDAAFLALLLVRGIPPIFTDSQVIEVSFQTERLGRRTDDLLLRCETGSGRTRRMNGQVKKSFTVSSSNEESVNTFRDFWGDFNNPDRFTLGTDALVIITRHGTNMLLEHFGALVDCARIARSADDFRYRLSTPGLISNKAIDYAAEVRAIIDGSITSDLEDEQLWQFLRHIHILSFDLNSSTHQTESLICTMLAQTATVADAVGAASVTWLRLLELVGREGMPQSGTYALQDLPEELRSLHGAIPTSHHAALQTLRDRTRTIRRGIRLAVGTRTTTFHIPRDVLANSVREALRTTRVVIITGPAGIGKSAVVSEGFDQLQVNHFAFAFRAEEFATSHLDITLQQASLQITTEALVSILAAQGSKVLLIDSVERLLEKSTRDAFTDLLALVRDDPSWQLILTCRNYSLDTVRSSFLDFVHLQYSVIDVPLLSDEELNQAIEVFPFLQRPSGNSQLRRLFRNPYILDKAASMSWQEELPLPVDERVFRQKFLQEVVRADQNAGEGMPQRRVQTFAEVALRRARALDAYAPTSGLDAAALESLYQRDLIAFPEGTQVLAAPAHDVLEDWAILQWIEDRSLANGTAFAAFIEELGPHPAIRRSYRNWLGEILLCDSTRADAYLQTVILDQSLPRYFRDDTFVAILRSVGATPFLRRNQHLLLANDAQLLRRVIHLIRVGCTTTPTWWAPNSRLIPLYFVPHGESWATVISLLRENLSTLLPSNILLIVGLLHDWSSVVSTNDTLPVGSIDACAISYALLPVLSDYRTKQPLERLVRLLSLIPLADERAFRLMIDNVANGRVNRYLADAVSDHILKSIEGFTACRDVPDAVVMLAEQLFYLTENDIRRPYFASHSIELEPYFGLKDCGSNDFFPASAFRGPFLFLLKCHPDNGISFIISFINRAIEWYNSPRAQRRDLLEPPWLTEISLAGVIIPQFCNARLWQMYRGTSVGPCILQSALMALEHWLLQICETHPADIESYLLRLLRESNNSAISAVVASVVTAFPDLSGSAAIALLSCRDFIHLDKMRLVAEASVPSTLHGIFPSRHEQRIYESEREQSDRLPHRLSDLEWAAIRLQRTQLREAIERVIDDHLTQLPRIEDQTDDDRIWRIALHRMDLRRYCAQVVQLNEASDDDTQSLTEGARSNVQSTRVIFQSDPLEPDIQAMLDRESAAEASEDYAMSFFMWGVNAFQKKQNESVAGEWRERLSSAMATQVTIPSGGDPIDIQLLERGIEFVAAVCIRDHWNELGTDEQAWCFDITCRYAAIGADSRNELYNMQRGGMDSSRAAAFVLPILLTKSITDEQKVRATEALAIGLTHAVDEVINYAIDSIRLHLWSVDPELCRVCVGAICRAARTLDERLVQQRTLPRSESSSPNALEREVAVITRREIIERRNALEDDVRLSSGGWYARRYGLRSLRLLDGCANEILAHNAYANAIQLIIRAWADEEDRNDRRDYQWESDCELQIARYCLSINTTNALALVGPILDALPEQAKEVASIVQDLVIAEESLRQTDCFWAIWQAIADRASQSTWAQELNRRNAEYDDLLRKLFLNLDWNEGVHDWHALERNAQRLVSLFSNLPPSAAVLDAFVAYLYSIGSKSLPWAFISISARFEEGNAQNMLVFPGTISRLETLVGRYVYALPAFLKSNQELRMATLHILDELIEIGSSRAYRMRDDFVTPISIERI